MTVRELWAMARGRADADAEGRVFWMRQLGQAVTADQAEGMNPFRERERPEPPADELDEAAAMDWDSFERALGGMSQQRG